jgi:hypothetical protein
LLLAVALFPFADEVLREVGMGTFGRVVECFDKHDERYA